MALFSRNRGEGKSPAAADEAEASPRVEYAIMPKALRIAAAALKGRAPVPDDKVVKVPLAEAFPLSAALMEDERRRAATGAKAQAEAFRNPTVGQLIEGKGIYMGLWEPKDRDGNSLGKKFALYAAPTDLDVPDKAGKKILRTFLEAIKELASRRSWHGYNGGDYKNDTALYKALADGSYNGEWFLPPKELVHGKNIDGNPVSVPHLYGLRDTGAFKGTFTTVSSGFGYARWFWSCTEDRGLPDYVCGVDFTDGNDGWNRRGNCRLSSRPCRAELVI